MGYPMTWQRMVKRNSLTGDYGDSTLHESVAQVARDKIAAIAGDMRRLERNAVDESGCQHFAKIANTTPETVKRVLEAFFAE